MTKPEQSIGPGTYRFSVESRHDGQRLDQFLAENSAIFSRSLAKRLIDVGGVHLSGRRMRRCSHPVSTGDRVEVFVDSQPIDAAPLDRTRILYHDQDVLVLDKPAGMATQPTPARYQGTLYAELQKLLQETSRKGQRPSIGMVQRLDRDTSGVMVFSIHPRAHKKMTEAFAGHDIDKVYWALVAGTPKEREGAFCSQLARRRSTNLTVSVEHGGKPAETRYRLLRAMSQASLVEVQLVTGRSHQIRAHFSEAGLPLLGDTAYGGPRSIAGMEIPRQMLHSRSLAFRHPVSGKEMTFAAGLPDDFAALLARLEGSLNALDV